MDSKSIDKKNADFLEPLSGAANTPVLEVKGLTMRFGGLTALRDVSFSVQKGSVTALIGPNGAGKTTVFNCVTGFYHATEGSLTFHSEKAGAIDISKIIGGKVSSTNTTGIVNWSKNLYYQMFGGSHLLARAGLVRTFQNVRLFSDMTVIENLLVAQHQRANKNLLSGLLRTPGFVKDEAAVIDTAHQWLKFLGMSHLANQLARNLPYGEQRRLEIARAMCTNPSLLCLDEPAAGLNHTETETLSKTILQLRDHYGVTVLLIEHDMSMVMGISDVIVVLDHGEILAKGTPSQVRESPEVIRAYLGT